MDRTTQNVAILWIHMMLCVSVALRKIDTIHLPSVDKPGGPGPELLQKPLQSVESSPRPSDLPARAPQPAERPQPADRHPPTEKPQPAERPQPGELPPKPHVLDLPPKPQLSDLPPKPQLSDLPPKPQLSDLPPKPQLKDLPPKPQLADMPQKPSISEAPVAKQTPQEEAATAAAAATPRIQQLQHIAEAQSSSQQEELSPRQASEDTNGAPAGAVEMPVPLPRKLSMVGSRLQSAHTPLPST